MPRTDPITGCQVMTNAEFWNAEAKAEGKGRTGADLIEDMMKSMNDENEREAQAYYDCDFALEFIKEAAYEQYQEWKEWKDEDPTCTESCPHQPTRVIEVTDVQYRSGFKGTTIRVTAKVECLDGRTRNAMLAYESYHGDFYEPPSEDSELTWEEIEV